MSVNPTAAEPQIDLSLPLGSVNFILQHLSKLPYCEVSGLIKSITDQALLVLNPPAQSIPPAPAAAEAAVVDASVVH